MACKDSATIDLVTPRELSAKSKDGVRFKAHLGPTSAIIAGPPRCGKSTLLSQYRTTHTGSKESFWLNLSLSEHARLDSVEKLASLHPHYSLDLREIQRNNGQNLAIFIDHLNTQPSSFIRRILSKSILKECTIIVATCYSNVSIVAACMVDYVVYEMEGLSKEDVPEVMLEMGRRMNLRSLDRMIDYIRSDSDLLDMCRNPGIITLVWEIFSKNECRCPKTKTAFMRDIVEHVIQSKEKSEIDEFFDCLCAMAFLVIPQQDLLCYDRHDFSCLCMRKEVCISAIEQKIGLGLMEIMNLKGIISCKFIHTSVQVYLAALHVHKQPIYDQTHILLQLCPFDTKYEMMLIFYFGIAHSGVTRSAPLNVKKIVLHPILETVYDKVLEGNFEPKLNLLLDCMHEAQEPSLVRKFLSRKPQLLDMHLDETMQSESKLQMLSYILANSAISLWIVEVPREKLYLTEFLKMLIMDQLTPELKKQFEFEVKEAFTFRLQAVSTTITGQTPAKLKPPVYFRILRELLHRLLQLYSPIRLKSDGSNWSYVSILACKCLQREVESNGILALQPIAACHWLPLKKNKKELDSNPQTLVHMHKHDDEYVEFVVMTTPFIHRIIFIMPGTKEEIIIDLSSCCSPDFFAKELVDQVATPVQRVYEEESFDSNRQKLIPPSLPLPKQSNSSAQTVAPEIPEAPKMVAVLPRDASSNRIGTQAANVVTNATNRNEEQSGDKQTSFHDQVGAFGSTFNYTNASMFEQTPHQAQSQRQVAMKPGVIIHTTIPTIFTSDQQYPLPDEGVLIRKGGNGEIYLGEFSGVELIIKKTSYRNREFQIHSKLRHSNVVQLLALMIGERNPSQRRKLTCYHFLPKMAGDLARLVVDHEENTLKNLRTRFGSDPKQFGLIQGNLKYILTQVLKGLAYLHGLKIAHRDLKSSNVLLKFHCSCSNPLMCICLKKCDVQLADFDSAIQLTKDGLLPASNAHKTDSHQQTFAVVPVGTMGYRPPESCQLIISNSVDVLSPPVCTKSDMWSFGVLIMKMVSGRYGPTSQRGLSTLILFHTEGDWLRSRPDYSRLVSTCDVRRVLKLSKLEEELSWCPSAVDCIKECLKINPTERRSAEELLKHPFLY